MYAYPTSVITPHTAFLTAEALAAIGDTTIGNVHEYLAGGELSNRVRPPPPA